MSDIPFPLVEDRHGQYVVKAYMPRGASKELFYRLEPEILLEGPAGTGKSLSLLHKAKVLATKFPKIRILFVRKTRASMNESTLATFENHVLDESFLAGGASRAHREKYVFPNKSEIVLGGMDNTLKIMSTDYDFVCVFEATELTPTDYEKIISRNRNNVMPFQQIVCDCNPGPPHHHLNIRADKGHMLRLKSKHVDNPMLFDDKQKPTREGKQYLKKLASLTGVRRDSLYLGLWRAAEGLVYQNYDPHVHVVDEHKFPYTHFLVGVDWGFHDPGVFQVWGIDIHKRMVLEYEIYRTKMDIDWWMRKAELIRLKYNPARWICDSASPEKISRMRRSGFPAKKAQKDILEGIRLVSSMLNPDHQGIPRILIKREARKVQDAELKEAAKCSSTEEEFITYCYPEEKEGIITMRNKEKPLDSNNHGMDALRYVSRYLDKYPNAGIVKFTG